MKSLGTFLSTPTDGKKLRLSSITKPTIPVPVSSQSTTLNIFDQPITDQGHSRDHPSDAQQDCHSSHHSHNHDHLSDTQDTRLQRSSSPSQHSHSTHRGQQQDHHSSHHGHNIRLQHSTSPLRYSHPIHRGHWEDHSSDSQCSRPTHSSCHSSSPSPWKRTASRSLSPELPAKQGKVAQWHNGQAPQGRAKAQDYEDSVYRGIIQACHDFEARIGSAGAWPDTEVQVAWARDCWNKVCTDIGEQYELTERILGLVCARIYIQLWINSLSFHRSSLVVRMLVAMSRI